MFGLEQDVHDDRYARGQEWLEVILRLWSEDASFDYDGRCYRQKGVARRPLPWGGRRPILMNAGDSVAGREFGAHHCDLVFDQPHYIDQAHDRIMGVLDIAREPGTEVQVFISGAVVWRSTQQEADEYFRFFAVENRDDGAINTMLNLYFSPANQRARTRTEAEKLRSRYDAGYGGLLAVGDPDTVAGEPKKLANGGSTGSASASSPTLTSCPILSKKSCPAWSAWACGRRRDSDLRFPPHSPGYLWYDALVHEHGAKH
jgi:dimethylsulfone monooxygenase